ncbi:MULTISPECIES: tyrosine-type recombinase/integrase [Priestia]|nr:MULTISPECIES: tyrosine-type recombinase/integrase [Priestia]MBX9996496.1 tyrosine-type recombinase/integrase [Priestia aryabhattai]MCP1447774.1 integrase/recombinase XerD [Priestia megaterium]MED4051053.1 tyrosine-type recombinase/integrase [Priestia megaterium]PGY54801.1 recombinase XerC [Priestia megaterium]
MNKNSLEVIPLIDDFSQWLIESGKSDNTIKTYRAVLNQFHEWLLSEGRHLDQVTRNNVQTYMINLESNNKSASTIEKAFVTISVFARFLEKPEIVQNIERKRKEKNNEVVPQSLEVSELDRLLSEVKQQGSLRDIAIVYTLLHTGIRVSEICALNHKDVKINKSDGFLIIRNAKESKKRLVPLSTEARNSLKKYIDSLDSNHEALFVSNFDRRMSARTVQYMLKKYNVNPHKLRHTFCHELVKKGIDIATVAELAGHSDVNVTKRYLKSSTRDLENAITQTFL